MRRGTTRGRRGRTGELTHGNVQGSVLRAGTVPRGLDRWCSVEGGGCGLWLAVIGEWLRRRESEARPGLTRFIREGILTFQALRWRRFHEACAPEIHVAAL